MMKPKAIFNWSGGKDSSLALFKLLQSQEYDILCLLTSVSEQYQRISMHGVRTELLELQAQSIGIPLQKLMIPEMPTMEVYEKQMIETLTILKNQGASVSVFGDIFLEDLRTYRENQLAKIHLKGIFPLWKQSTKELIREFLDLGFKTITTCVNEKYLDKSFVGRVIDEDFLKDLPSHVDPCGENGEFHTFVYDGPIFQQPIPFQIGEIVHRTYTPTPKNNDGDYECGEKEESQKPFDTGFWYCDLLS
ncbi:MAG: diphthine--ammonia ligase [Raineya sp.]|nr:diphthine--ammonia ligase [Raineya sp.]